MKYQLAQKKHGADPEKWRDVRAMKIPANQLDTMIADRYGAHLVGFVREQLTNGRVVELAWGYLKQLPQEGE